MHYLLTNECTVVCKADVIKYILLPPVFNGRLGKWMLSLAKFDLRYDSAKVVKGHVLADFLVKHNGPTTYVETVP
jgi:hypothetical protein